MVVTFNYNPMKSKGWFLNIASYSAFSTYTGGNYHYTLNPSTLWSNEIIYYVSHEMNYNIYLLKTRLHSGFPAEAYDNKPDNEIFPIVNAVFSCMHFLLILLCCNFILTIPIKCYTAHNPKVSNDIENIGSIRERNA